MTHALSLLATLAALAADLPAEFQLGPALGPHVGRSESKPAGRDIAPGTPTLATTYFYWYDAESKYHILDSDGSDALTSHPPTLEGFSYKNVDWHQRQLRDMIEAGIDVLMPVYWGYPGAPEEHWSDAGLGPLMAARQRLVEAGEKPPAIGMFYDTSTLQWNHSGYHVDLTTPAGQRWFYGTIRNFFSQVSREHRATIGGKPLVFLYTRSFARSADEKLFPAVREMFRRDFGCDLYLVKMLDWPGAADSEYQWGGALAPQIHATAGIGPGYDHSAVPGRSPLVRERQKGDFYRFSWERLLARNPRTRPWLVHIETWNEFHEGTDIAESAEYGRQYIELTRYYADRFHAGQQIDPTGGLPQRKEVLASPEKADGLTVLPRSDGDGPFEIKTVAGRKAWVTRPNTFSEHRYLYFDADLRFLYDGDETVEITVGYLDSGPNDFTLHYDSADPELTGLTQQFRTGYHQPIQQTGCWREATFTVPHARFADRANGSDFRLAASQGELIIGHVRLRRP